MDTTNNLACPVQTTNDLFLLVHALSPNVDLQSTHAVVDHRSDDGHVEGIIGFQGEVVVELLPPLVPGLAATIGFVGSVLGVLGLLVCEHVVLLEGGLDVVQRDAVLLGELLHVLVALHDASALVVLAVPGDLRGGLAVQAEEEPSAIAQGHTLILPHHACDVVSPSEFIAESLALHVEEDAADASQGLGSQELDLGVRLARVHKASRMHLNPLEIHALGANGHGHLQAVTSAVVPVGGRKVAQVGSVLVQEGVSCEVCAETAGAQDNRAVLLEDLALLVHALAAADIAVLVGEQLGHSGLEVDLGATVAGLCDLFELLHQAVSDRHSWESLLASVSARHGVAAKTRNQAQIHSKSIDDPIDGRRTLFAENLDQLRSASSTPHGVLSEDLGRVSDLEVALSSGQGSVDAAGGLGAVATEEGALVDDANLDAMLQDGVGSGQTTQTTADDNDLLHLVK
mmetsp:Transcript_4436/g.6516  ORF Transcript_4436/g.6516 Transcript_4436/m.6516 type:complete len:457 (-) Transcript_4436:4-1374(-)